MPGTAAVAIWCDVDAQAKVEYDDWHAHEHMPERLAIPGFLRGSRWESSDGRNSYHMLYELRDETILTGPEYLASLNNPTPWSRRMMPEHRGMVRSLCRVLADHGAGLGRSLLSARYSSEPAFGAHLLGALPARRGIVSAKLLRDIPTDTPQTEEQRIRGGDATADWILLASGYDGAALDSLAEELMLPAAILRRYELAFTIPPQQ